MSVIDLGEARQLRALDRANAVRDADMVAEFERRCAEALADVAELGGVGVHHLAGLLMAQDWTLPVEPDPSPSGGGASLHRFPTDRAA